MEKGESGSKPAWVGQALAWGPQKYGELRTFFTEVRSELKKVTWPARDEVKATTAVVILTTVFFGVYLYMLDLLLSRGFSLLLGK